MENPPSRFVWIAVAAQSGRERRDQEAGFRSGARVRLTRTISSGQNQLLRRAKYFDCYALEKSVANEGGTFGAEAYATATGASLQLNYGQTVSRDYEG